MRVAVVARWPVPADPHTGPLLHTLRAAGHEVVVVTDAHGAGALPGLATEVVESPGRAASLWDRLRGRPPAERRTAATTAALRRADPDLVHVLRHHDLPAATALGRPVLAPLALGRVEHDLRWLAPTNPGAAADHVPSAHHTASDDRPAATPAPGRHAGRTIVLCARLTPTNPSRYLRAALERAGVELVAMDGELDWDRVPADADGVVVVESPWPALPVRGTRPPDVPLLFWVHHGEHHLPVNLRLAARYGADAVLLAHSWHLAHRFGVPVHRFPFAVAPEVFDGGRPWSDRDVDVAMVAAGLGSRRSPRYPRRARWTDALAPFGDRAELTYGLTPAEMATLYGRARLVLNEGGTRHLPITMRVFEAVGAGALLVTDPLPGTDLLLDGNWAPLADDDLADQVRRLAADPSSADVAARARELAMGRHTYDHRVDELVEALAATEVRPHTGPAPVLDGAMDDDVEVQTVAALDVEVELPDRAVAVGAEAVERLADGRFDAVVVTSAATVDDVGAPTLLDGARRYVYASPAAADRLSAAEPDLVWHRIGPWCRTDRDGPGYRVRSADHPLAD